MLKTIQAGRGLAAVAVLLFHLSLIVGHETGTALFWNVLQYGNRGVDFFFVLSGFIIMHAHYRDIGVPRRWTNFVRKRFVRVYPIYWLFSAGVVAALVVGLGQFPLPDSVAGWLAAVTLVRFSPAVPPLPQAWTLFHEVLFYAAFSLLILNRRLGILVLGAWMAAVLALFHYPENQHLPASVLLSAHNLNFALGIGAWLVAKRLSPTIALGAVVAGVAVFVGTTFLAHPNTHPSAIGYGIGCAVLISGLAAWESGQSVRIPFAVPLGNASYSIYLTHEVAQVVGVKIAQAAGIGSPISLFLVAGLFSLLGGVLAYQLVEKWVLLALRPKGARAHVASPRVASHPQPD